MDWQSASSLVLRLYQEWLLMLQIWNGKQQEGHLYPERFSRFCEKFSISLFVISNLLVDGGLWDVTHGRQFISNTTKSSKQKSNKLLLLLDRENISGFFNLQERTHMKNIIPHSIFCRMRLSAEYFKSL